MVIPTCTRVTSEWPRTLGKCFHLDAAGSLVKETSGNMSKGSFRVESFDSPEVLIGLLASFKPNEALSASVPINGSAEGRIAVESKLGLNPGALARSSKHFKLADAPGLAVVDVDEAELALEQLRDELLCVAPALSSATLVGWYSGSSLIFNGNTCLSPAKGLRLYLPIASTADWPRTLRALNVRLALRGHFRYIVSSAGAVLNRFLLDPAMADAGARLDFAPAGAICAPPLEQRRPPPQILQAGAFLTDTRKAVPDITPEEDAQFAAVKSKAREAVRAEAEAIRSAWCTEQEQKAITKAAAKGQPFDPEQIRSDVRRTLDAAFQGSLMSGFPLVYADPEGREHPTTVEELLRDPKHWHGKRFLCPLNREHRNRSPDAIAYLDQPSPVLFDLDTRTAYRLIRQQLALQVIAGERARLASLIAEHLTKEPDLFLLNGQLVLHRQELSA